MADAPRVFISYSHDSDEHAARVLDLANTLRALGIDVILDQYIHPAPAEGWPRWMDRNLDEAQFVLMVCTAIYHRRVMDREEPGKGLGVRWEGSLIYNRIYHDRSSGSRFIPVLLPGSEPAHIPNPIQGHAYYRIAMFDLTDPGFEALYRHLTDQPATPRPDLGALTILLPRPRPRPSPGPQSPSGGPTTNVGGNQEAMSRDAAPTPTAGIITASSPVRVICPMSKTIFVSYSTEQGDWVWDRLVSCLKAGGAEVRIDREQVEAARRLYKQLDDEQDRAALNVLVFSRDYLDSKFCQHEMRRALRRDPKFDQGIAIPLKRVECELPPAIKRSNPLCVDLRDDQNATQWDHLLKKCGADLGTTAPEWLRVRDELRHHLREGESVNLIVGAGVRWRPLIENLRHDSSLAELGVVNLEDPATVSRPGLVGAILQECGLTGLPVPDKPNDLVELKRRLPSHRAARVALIKFDLAARRSEYELDLFSALRFLTTATPTQPRKLVLLIQSRINFTALLPSDHPLTSWVELKIVELRGRA